MSTINYFSIKDNANPSSLAAALETLAAMPGKKLLVLGDMAELGDDGETWHGWAGKVVGMMGVEEVFTIGELAGLAPQLVLGKALSI